MEKIRLGKTGMMVSRVGLGGIPLQRLSEDEIAVVIRRCLEVGINFIDTAYAYANTEELIGKAISGRREEVILATKTLARNSEELKKHLKESLERLGVEFIDLYQFHGIGDSDTLNTILAPDGPMAVVQEAKKVGVVKHIGASSHSIEAAIEIVKAGYFETIMAPFNVIAREAIDELLPLCREHDVGFIAMKPLAGGMLDNVTVAFKYILQFPEVVPIPGMQELREIDGVVQILEGSHTLTKADKKEMERMRKELGTKFCRCCLYCQPCPEEIRIPSVMIAPTLLRRLPLKEDFFSENRAEVMEKAANNCTQCGECEEKCPYHLPIREMIEENVTWYRAERKKYLEQVASR